MRRPVTSVLWIGLIVTIADVGVAQDRNDRRRQFFEGVLRTLVESQVDRQPEPDNRPPNRGPRNPQLAAAYQTLQRFAGESDRLMASLRREELTNQSYRALLGDVVAIKAQVDVLLRRGIGISDQQFSNQYLEIDRQWRLVAHRLTKIPNVRRVMLTHVEKLNVYDQQICELLQLSPQVDRVELSRNVVEMHVSLSALLEDVSYLPARQPSTRAMLLEGQTLLARVNHLRQRLAHNIPHQAIVADYQQVYTRWRALAIQFRSVSDRRMLRQIQRIERANDAIHELLWIPKAVDRGELLNLIKVLQRDVNHLHHGITLDHLLEHPHAQETVASALAINKLCADLVRSLEGQTSLDELLWDFRTLEVEWQTASGLLGDWGEPDINQQLAAAQRTVEVLSQSLGQDLAIDTREVLALAAAIHDGANALAAQTARLANSPNQYPLDFRRSVVDATREFEEAAHHLHESMTGNASRAHLKRDTLDLAKYWESVKEIVVGLDPQHFAILNQIGQPLGPKIAKMQILYAY